MFWIALAVLASIVGGIRSYILSRRPDDNKYREPIGWVFVGVVGVLIGYVVAMAAGAISPTPPVRGEVRLVALGDNQVTGGRFFLGSGIIEQEPVYIYYYEWGDAIRQSWVSTTEASVYEDRAENAILRWKHIPKRLTMWKFDFGRQYDWEFHVPPGTVDRDFTLDLE